MISIGYFLSYATGRLLHNYYDAIIYILLFMTMLKLHLLKEGIKFTNWGQVYLGVKQGWINIEEVFRLFDSNFIPYEENRDVRLYLARDISLLQVLTEIKLFSEEDGFPPIKYKDDNVLHFGNQLWIHPLYWDIWEAEFLLRIRNKNLSKRETLDQIDFLDEQGLRLFYNWSSFQLYARENNVPVGVDKLYDNFINYLSMKIDVLRLKQ